MGKSLGGGWVFLQSGLSKKGKKSYIIMARLLGSLILSLLPVVVCVYVGSEFFKSTKEFCRCGFQGCKYSRRAVEKKKKEKLDRQRKAERRGRAETRAARKEMSNDRSFS